MVVKEPYRQSNSRIDSWSLCETWGLYAGQTLAYPVEIYWRQGKEVWRRMRRIGVGRRSIPIDRSEGGVDAKYRSGFSVHDYGGYLLLGVLEESSAQRQRFRCAGQSRGAKRRKRQKQKKLFLSASPAMLDKDKLGRRTTQG
jgi:hypothetical protein